MRQKTMFLVVIASLALGFAASGSHAQESQSILPSLLVEVRGLRVAMEQMVSTNARVQLALGRLQLQEQRLSMLVMKLDSTRMSLAASQRQLTQQQTQFADMETAAREGVNAEMRREAEVMLKAIKQEMTSNAAEVQRLTTEEASIAADVAAEQARWNDLNQRLEELERALGRR
jgi:chromosome segregation ATPase